MRRDRLLSVAAFFLLLGHLGATLMTPDDNLATQPWAQIAVLDWLCAMAIVGHSRSWLALALGGSYLVNVAADVGYGVHEILLPPNPTYAAQMIEYRAQLAYWWTNYAVALGQCGLLIGYAGGTGGKRIRSAYRGRRDGRVPRRAFGRSDFRDDRAPERR